jgi:murein DD-endopeptidase MepM/ murein hydrolase activator NlpD
MKLKLIIACLFFVSGSSLFAQYVNTDSLVFVSGVETPLAIRKIDKLELISSGPHYDNNLKAGELLMQFAIPGEGKIISHFGPRSGRMHTGTDIKMQKGDTIYAAFNGSVSRASYYYGYGNLVVIQHDKNIETYYGHLSRFLVKSGDWIQKGEPLGLAGATGRATTSHLHFEIRENNNPYDPELVFDFETDRVRSVVGNKENLAELHQELKPKGYSVNKPMTQHYVVRSGDSLWKISKRAKTSIQTLCRINSLSENSVLQVGQVLKVF